MRIGLNALQIRAAKSGVGQYIAGLIDGLLQCMPAEDRLVIYATRETAPNYKRHDPRVELRVFSPQARRAAQLLHEWFFLPGQIARDHIDVFHGPSNFLPRHCPCPAVVTIHDASRQVDPSRFTRANLLYWAYMMRHTVRMNTPVITVSHAAAADLQKHLQIAPERIRVIYEAAHAHFSAQPSTDDAVILERLGVRRPYLLNVATLEPGKNTVRLIEAYARYRRAVAQPATLVLAGDRGWKSEAVFETIEREGLREHVQYIGHVKDDALPALFRGARFFLFPSLNEGFGLPPLEAMQCGTPVIAANSSSLPEVLGDAALYVNPLSVDDIADKIIDLWNNDSLREELRTKGLQQAARYSWQKTGEQTLKVYRSLGA